MKLENVLDRVGDSVSGRRVFAKPIEHDGVTVIPAAVVMGGGGGGSSNGANGSEAGSGGGFGVYAFPVGAYVIRKGRVRWKPAVDVGWMAIFALMALRIVLRHRRDTR